jgi:hypothetical protein
VFYIIATDVLFNAACSYWKFTQTGYFLPCCRGNLPYLIVEPKSFQHLLEILNPATLNMDYGRKTISKEVDMLYMVHKNSIQEILLQVKYLSFTVDAWTSPNSKAFMAITANGITSDWKMMDIVVGMPPVTSECNSIFCFITSWH